MYELMLADSCHGCTEHVSLESVCVCVQKPAADDMDLLLDHDNSKPALHYSDKEQIE